MADPADARHLSIDALLPQDIAVKAEAVGIQKVRRDALTLFVLGVLAGAFIGFGALFSTVMLAGGEALPFGVGRLIAGFAFSLGLILVVLGGAELFTGNALMVMALAAGKLRLVEMLRAWAIVYAGNFVGAAGLALLVFYSGHHLLGDGAVAAVALKIADTKAALPFGRALLSGILCNALVCLAVWLAMGARTTADKVLAIVFPITAFVAGSFEHCVANMYFIPFGWMIKLGASDALWAQLGQSAADYAALTPTGFLANVIPATIGNIIGGGVLVGAIYWFVYLRTRPH